MLRETLDLEQQIAIADRSCRSHDFWTGERDDFLRRAYTARMPLKVIAIEINKQFGTSYTRNSCAGRANRLGLRQVERRTRAQQKRVLLPAASEVAKPRRVKRPQPALPDVPLPVTVEPEDTMAPIDLPGGSGALITVLDLKSHHCRFPFGQGPFHFCGATRRKGYPYCATHVAVTHNPEAMRR